MSAKHKPKSGRKRNKPKAAKKHKSRGLESMSGAHAGTNPADAVAQPGNLETGGNAGALNQSPSNVGELMDYDPYLLERSRTQWQFGDWQSLAAIDPHALAHHPQRAELSLLAAAGHLQSPEPEAQAHAKTLIKQAFDTGAKRETAARLLIGGVHANLAKSAALAGQSRDRVLGHFEQALRIGTPGADIGLLSQPSAMHQLAPLADIPAVEHLIPAPLPVNPRRLDQSAAPASRLAQQSQSAASPDAQNPPLFYGQVEVDDASFAVGFYPDEPNHYAKQPDGGLAFKLAKGKPGYLVSNESGHFNTAPKTCPLALKPDTAYEFTAHITTRGGETPVVWVFEYTNGKQSEKRSYPTENGRCKQIFRTHAAMTSAALGLRVSGDGLLDPTACCFYFKSSQAMAVDKARSTEQLQQLRMTSAESHLGLESDRSRKRAKGITAPSPPIRTLHALAGTGGTLISRCLAAQLHTHVLSEVDPLSPFVPGGFLPTDLIGLSRFGSRSADQETQIDLFLAGLRVLYEQANDHGQALILREHSHGVIHFGESIPERPGLREIVGRAFPVTGVAIVRHPFDAFLNLQDSGWVQHFNPPTLEEYARRTHHFLDAHADCSLIRYEDFVAEPRSTMQRLCEEWRLSYSPDFVDTFATIKLSGDSGRCGDTISPRPRRPYPPTLEQEAREAESFTALLRRLDYAF